MTARACSGAAGAGGGGGRRQERGVHDGRAGAAARRDGQPAGGRGARAHRRRGRLGLWRRGSLPGLLLSAQWRHGSLMWHEVVSEACGLRKHTPRWRGFLTWRQSGCRRWHPSGPACASCQRVSREASSAGRMPGCCSAIDSEGPLSLGAACQTCRAWQAGGASAQAEFELAARGKE